MYQKALELTDVLGRFSISIEEITDWFSKYEVNSIELWISGIIESSGITKLVMSAKGEGGLKVVLKTKTRLELIKNLVKKRSIVALFIEFFYFFMSTPLCLNISEEKD